MNPGDVPPITLAYLGDAVLTLKAREAILSSGITKPADCSRAGLFFVPARAQAEAARALAELFTEEEKEVFHRARNAKSHSAPRHTEIYTYRLATALEAVFGFLHLKGEGERIDHLFAVGFEKPIANLEKI